MRLQRLDLERHKLVALLHIHLLELPRVNLPIVEAVLFRERILEALHEVIAAGRKRQTGI